MTLIIMIFTDLLAGSFQDPVWRALLCVVYAF